MSNNHKAGDEQQPALPPRLSETATDRGGLGTRTRSRIIALVVLSSLAPAMVVGLTSYLTARGILLDKVNNQLAERVEATSQQVALWLTGRVEDAHVFATSFLVSENLAVLRQPGQYPDELRTQAVDRIEQYLRQVSTRDAQYLELAIFDAEGEVVARPSPADATPPIEHLPAQDGTSTEPLLLRHRGADLVYTIYQLRTDDDQILGTLVSGASLGPLWRRLGAIPTSEGERLKVIDSSGRLLFDSSRGKVGANQPAHSEGIHLCLESVMGGIAEYRNEDGNRVLGGYQMLPSAGIGILVEVPAKAAFAAVSQLHLRSFLFSLGAASLMAFLAFLLAINVSRPLKALIEGARAVSRGDLSHRVKVESEDEFGYLTQVFNRMTGSLQASHTELERLSTTDGLTGLNNRRQLTPIFHRELNRMVRSRQPLSVLMIDIDHFKAFNDEYGHQQGDIRLRETADFLRSELRPSDEVVRYGGEEFVVLLPGSSKELAAAIGERMRRNYEERFSAHGGTRGTVSIGVSCGPEDGSSEDQLTRTADAALYDAKGAGRNRVAVASNEPGRH